MEKFHAINGKLFVGLPLWPSFRSVFLDEIQIETFAYVARAFWVSGCCQRRQWRSGSCGGKWLPGIGPLRNKRSQVPSCTPTGSQCRQRMSGEKSFGGELQLLSRRGLCSRASTDRASDGRSMFASWHSDSSPGPGMESLGGDLFGARSAGPDEVFPQLLHLAVAHSLKGLTARVRTGVRSIGGQGDCLIQLLPSGDV